MTVDVHNPRRDAANRLAVAVFASFFLNAAGALAFAWGLLGDDDRALPNVATIDAHAFAVATPDDVPPPPPPPDVQRQYVSLPAPVEEERPDEANFYDQYDRAVDRETVNPDDLVIGASAVDRQQIPASANEPNNAEELAPDEVRVASIEPSGEPAPDSRAGAPQGIDLPTVGENSASGGTGDAAGADAGDGDGTTTGEGGGASVDLSAFNPTRENAALLLEGAVRRDDYLALEEGDRTQLNSYRSLYWSFFSRIHDQLSQEWDPLTVLRRNDPSGVLYGGRDRYTVLAITLEGDGSLRHAWVRRSSDLDFLDQEALRALEAAAPFPNVPEGLKDEYGRVEFDFGFYVTSDRRTIRVRRVD